ncbi:O-antigen ligase family protein [Arthrobacter bambusae]|uniref:O-antigen ligase family protein n=1 Tax=Arthrobacter bambusae TaxID=1338426 RepID=UPI0027836DB9|nr:O-antigen ligase family protein [Arthrobacter bambusae]MDQ0031454.1 O-antigen ligase [Arthrobacter bambusae]MDQ0099658.1 O-antigen ligase [Arthrobacter bambusae]
MTATSVLLGALATSVAFVVVAIVLTSKTGASKHLFPSLVVYSVTALSIASSVVSPRLTSTSTTDVLANPAGDAAAKVATIGAIAIFVIAVMLAIVRKIPMAMSPIAWSLISYGAVGFFSSLANAQPWELGMTYTYLLVAGVGIGATWTFAEALPVIRRCLRAYIWSSLALMIISPSLAFWDVQGRELFGFKQLAGVTTHPNGLGTVAAVAIFVELLRATGRRRFIPLNLVATVVVLLLTQSRGAWLAAVIGAFFWIIGRAKNSSVRLAAPLVVAAIIASIAFQDVILGALEETTNQRDFSTLNGRTDIWTQSLVPLWGSPLIGRGALVFDTRFRWDALGLNIDAGHSNAHNQIIQTLIERGFLGLVILAVLLWLMFRAAWRQPISYRGPILAMLMVYVSRFAVETPLYFSSASLNTAMMLLIVTLLTANHGPTGPEPPGHQRELSLGRPPRLVQTLSRQPSRAAGSQRL